MASSKPDVNDMFEKMGQRLGWFKQNNLDETLKVLSSKKKKSSKLRLQKHGNDTNPAIENQEKNANTKAQSKKTAKSVNDAAYSNSKSTNNVFKASSFKGILSSDSDSNDEKCVEDKNKCNLFVPKTVLVAASDSEDDAPVVREDTYIECIGESPVSSARQSLAPLYDTSANRKSGDKELYEDTILKSRVSMATYSFDVDSIGDPLVESTRIHRRSSVSYNQFISPDTSGGNIGGTGSSDTSPCLQKPNQHGMVDKDGLCARLDNLTLQKSQLSIPEVIDETECLESSVVSPHNNSRYITAIDNLGDLDACDDADKDNKKYSEGEAAKDTVDYVGKSRQGSETGSECEVEVVDMATQTSDTEEDTTGVRTTQTSDTEADTTGVGRPYTSSVPLSICQTDSIYRNVTISEPAVYHNETVCRNTAAVDDTEDMEVNSKLSDYEHPTRLSGEHLYDNQTELASDNVYNDTTRVKTAASISTLSAISMSPNSDRENETVSKTGDISVHDTSENENVSKTGDISGHDTSQTSEGSIIEVRDMATQTDPILKSNDTTEKTNHSTENQTLHDISKTSFDSCCESNSEEIEGKINKSKGGEQSNTKNETDNELKDHVENEHSNVSVDTSGRDSDLDDPEMEGDAEKDIDDQINIHSNISVGDVGEKVTTDISELEENASAQEKMDNINDIKDNDLSSISISSADKKAEVEEGDKEKSSISSDTSSTTHKKSSANFSLLSSDSDSDDEDESPVITNIIRKKKEPAAAHEKHTSQGGDILQRSDNANQSWRTKKRYDSESSDDDEQLEAFFQKLRKPEKKVSSDSEQSADERSLDDFIVEDDDISSESEDEAFHIRETQKMEEESLAERLKKHRGLKVNNIGNDDSDEEEDEAFSSKIYPDSVTKHKQKIINKPRGTPRSWSLSSDSDSSNGTSPQLKRGTGRTNGKEQAPRQQGRSKGNVTKKMNFEDFSSSSDENENEDPLFKTPNPIRKVKKYNTDADKENSPFLKRPKGKKNSGENNNGKVSKTKPFSGYISISDDDISDSDDDLYTTVGSMSTDNNSSNNVSGQDEPLFSKMPTPISKGRQLKSVTPLATRGHCTYSFLKSLSNIVEDDGRRHPDALRFLKNFKRTKEELLPHLFSMYNRTIFEGKLPSDLPLLWNKRLLSTAGYCTYKNRRGNKEDRTASIELSTKVCDSAERVRDTLIHELCHAAVWLLNGVNGGHGPFWKYWARHANRVHPELPAIGRCHSYSINTKFTYRCTKCGYSIGRHSKSLNTEKKVCGLCRGTFQLIKNDTPATPNSASSSSLGSAPVTPRTPNKFALFVKDNYNTVKQKDKSLKHGDVMKELSKLFAKTKVSNG